jgi:hypothetical protein
MGELLEEAPGGRRGGAFGPGGLLGGLLGGKR